MSPETWVLDASAVLAYIQDEPGEDIVRGALSEGAAISAVNLAEVHSTLVSSSAASDEIVARMKAVGLYVVPFEEADAAEVGRLRALTRKLGLSLGDRACLALARRLHGAVLTTDGGMRAASVEVDVRLIR